MSRVLSLRVTDDEAVDIEQRAARFGLTVSQYLRRCVLPGFTVAEVTAEHEKRRTWTLGTPQSSITWTWKAA